MTETQIPIVNRPTGRDIVARPDSWYRGKRLIFAVALILGGGWFGYDGWIGWPRENEAAKKVEGVQKLPHSDLDLQIQRILAVVLPVLGAVWLVRILYTSRGVYRLRGDTLSIPGHPDIPIDAITQIDLQRWDRKGIAVLDYDFNGVTGQFKLDDFLYDRKPTDDILDRIKARIAPEEPPPPAEIAETAAPARQGFPVVPPVKGTQPTRSRPS